MSAQILTLTRPAKGLPEGKTHADALAVAVQSRQFLWSADMPEERRLQLLESQCVKLYGGNRKAGRALAQEAIWA